MDIQIYCDGGARGNPGPAAIGIVAKIQNSEFKIQKHTISKPIGTATNNQAEYKAVIEALGWLAENLQERQDLPERINFFLDSNLVVNQLNGRYKVKNNKLRDLLMQVRILERSLFSFNPNASIRYNYIPREKNAEADNLVNKALDRKK